MPSMLHAMPSRSGVTHEILEMTGCDTDLKALCRAQLGRLFGDQAADPIEDYLYDWAADPFTATDQDQVASGAHGYLERSFSLAPPWEDMMRLIGSEATAEQGGYMEGALGAVDVAMQAHHRSAGINNPLRR